MFTSICTKRHLIEVCRILPGSLRETFIKPATATASATASAISITITMGESTIAGDAVDKLVRALNGKFSGLKLDVWKRTAQSVISMRHAGISDILEGRPCPDSELISPRPSSRKSRPSQAVTRSQAADETDTQSGETPPADTAEYVQPDAGSTPMDTAHLIPSSSGYYTLPTVTSVLWATDDNISNLEDIKHWHRDNRLLFDFLFPITSGAAASFLRQFKPNEVNVRIERLLEMVWSRNIIILPANVDVYSHKNYRIWS